MRKVLLVVAVVIVLVVGGGLLYARPILLTATGYAAHNACAVEILAGRPAGSAVDDLPSNPLVPYLRTTVDVSEGTARSTLLGLFGQTAWHSTHHGCTLADERPDLPDLAPVDLADPTAEWPQGERTSPPADLAVADALDAALDAAFAPLTHTAPDGTTPQRGTRAVVVVHEGRIVAERYAEGFDADTPQLGWSMAKSITSTLVGRLAQDGVIALDDDGLLPVWADDARARITVEDLLRMTGGLAWDETYDLGTPITEMLYLQDDMGAFAADQPMAHDVGAYQQYSSGTTNVVCDVLHDRSGMGAEMAHELVFRPLGMASAVLEPDAAGDLVCSSYAWATPRDWARFGWWVAQDGEWDGERLLPEGWMAATTEPTDVATSEEQGLAAHWWVNDPDAGVQPMPSAPDDTFWAAGHDGQRLMVVPSADLVVLRMGFSPGLAAEDIGYESLLTDVLDALGS